MAIGRFGINFQIQIQTTIKVNLKYELYNWPDDIGVLNAKMSLPDLLKYVTKPYLQVLHCPVLLHTKYPPHCQCQDHQQPGPRC